MKELRNEVYNADCVTFMRTLPDEYFDLACADPPYGISISSNPVRQAHEKKKLGLSSSQQRVLRRVVPRV